MTVRYGRYTHMYVRYACGVVHSTDIPIVLHLGLRNESIVIHCYRLRSESVSELASSFSVSGVGLEVSCAAERIF